MSRILIVDDEPAICWSLRGRLADEGHEVQIAASVERAEAMLSSFIPDLIVLDIRLPGIDGNTALPRFRERWPSVPIIMMTAFGDLQTVVESMQRGAFEYLVKPFELSEFMTTVGRALKANVSSAHEALPSNDSNQLVGRGPGMQAVFKQIALVAPTDFPALITGETGTGKELVAAAIHRHSARGKGSFVCVSLASLNPTVIESELFGHVKGAFTRAIEDRPGLFESAENGTIFLDEIGETPLAIQVKLLRVLESRTYTRVGSNEERTTNARLIAATNQNLETMIAEGTFREDLYHRLRVFSIELPPLRNRREDLRPLVDYFLAKHPNWTGQAITDEFLAAIEQRAWHGNIRELRNAIDHAVVLARSGPLSAEHLPPPLSQLTSAAGPPPQLESAIADWVHRQLEETGEDAVSDLYRRFLGVAEGALFHEILSHTQQNRTAAAKILGLDRATLRTKLSSGSPS